MGDRPCLDLICRRRKMVGSFDDDQEWGWQLMKDQALFGVTSWFFLF